MNYWPVPSLGQGSCTSGHQSTLTAAVYKRAKAARPSHIRFTTLIVNSHIPQKQSKIQQREEVSYYTLVTQSTRRPPENLLEWR
jgi:hypothetical protein